MFQNLIVALRAQSVEKHNLQLIWTLSRSDNHPRYSDHIYFKVSYSNHEWLVELQLRKLKTIYIEVRCESIPTKSIPTKSIQYAVYQNIREMLILVCDTFPHTRHLKPRFGTYCHFGDGLHFFEYNEDKVTFLCNICDQDKSETMAWFQRCEEVCMFNNCI